MELTIQNLTRRYGDKTAVDGVNLTLTPGVWGLLGANGAGKTTLMRMLAGILTPTDGRVLCDGVDTRDMGEAWRDMLGYLPQSFGFYPEFTVADYLDYMAALKGIEKHDARERIGELCETLSLTRVYKSKIKKLSGGTQRRVGIAQALLNDPDVLILDEPTSGLDPGERVRFRNLLSEFARGRIVLISTHIVSDVEYIAAENAVMKDGRLIDVGTTAQLLRAVEGKVFTALAPESELPRTLEREVRIVSLKNEGEGRVLLRYVADSPAAAGSEFAEPRLEDLYLWLFQAERGRAMYKLELKRLLKTRSTWILMAAALLVTLILCCVNIFNPYYYAYDGESLHGLAATEMRRIVTQSSEGEWTPERIRDVFAQLAEANANYGVAAGGETNDSFEVLAGDDADAAAIAGYTSTFLRSIPQVFDVQYVNEITPDMAAQYYTQRKAYIEEVMTLNYGPAAAEAALRLDEDTTEPFYYEFGFGTGSNIASTLPVCLFAVAVACSVICAPVFASDYSTGADDIQRCARYGRKRLGKSRLLAAMTLSTVLYVVCAGVFVALTLAVFGDDKTSAQLALDALVLIDIDMNGVLILTLIAGLLSVFAMTAFTLWLSARMRSGVAVLAVTLAVAMTPTFLIVLLRESAVGDWLRLLLPSGGLGLGTGMFVDIQVGKFLTIGSLAIWTPFVMLAAPVIEAPVFALLAQRAYVRREDAALPRRRPRHA